jgi:LAO/AO transport system kinase
MSDTPMGRDKKPEWGPDGCGEGSASRVWPGKEGGHDGIASYRRDAAAVPRNVPKRAKLGIEQYAEGVLAGNRAVIGRAITLVESNVPEHMKQAQELLLRLMPSTGRSIRMGVTGVPGVGKSLFIEAFGCYLLGQGKKVAVLAVDPSSSITGGSILGDKTRMEALGRDPRCFIRPSPSGGTLGGVARKSRETLLVCEAAGFDVIIIETVGVGQSEITVRSMVDFFLLLMLAGAGDELQGIKRGVMEIADALVITKADGDNRRKAEAARSEFERAIHYLRPATKGWFPPVGTCSSVTGDGIEAIWTMIRDFERKTRESGIFDERRRHQILAWVHSMVDEYLRTCFEEHPAVREHLPRIEERVAAGELPPTTAVQRLLDLFEGRKHPPANVAENEETR